MSKANKSNKAIKYRLYPNDEQKVMFAKTLVAVVLSITNYLPYKNKDTKMENPIFLSLNQMSSLLVH